MEKITTAGHAKVRSLLSFILISTTDDISLVLFDRDVMSDSIVHTLSEMYHLPYMIGMSISHVGVLINI